MALHALLFTFSCCGGKFKGVFIYVFPFLIPVGPRVGRKRVQGLEGEAYHSPALAAGHPRRRGAGQPDQGDDRRRWCHPSYPQIADRQEES